MGAFAKRFMKGRQGQRVSAPAAPVSKKRPSTTKANYPRKKSTGAFTRGGSRVSFNAISNKRYPLAVPGAIAQFVHLPSMMRVPISTSTSRKMFLVVMATPSDATAILVLMGPGTNVDTTSIINLPQLAQADPLTIRPSRLSISIRNVTEAQSVAGVVRVLSTPSHVPIVFNGPGAPTVLNPSVGIELMTTMESSPFACSYGAHEFLRTREIVSPPASIQGFKSYSDFIKYDETDDTTRHASNQAFVLANAAATNNQIIIEFNPVASVQNFDISLHRSDCTRYPLTSVLAQLAQPAPVGNEASFTSAVAAAQAVATRNPVQSSSSSGNVPYG